MIRSGYQEGLYYREGLPVAVGEVEQSIRALLRENHGVGILGGFYEPDAPLCMVSELTVQMLGYASAEEFEQATENSLTGLLRGSDCTAERFCAESGSFEIYLRGREKKLWVRIVKRDRELSGGRRMWLASVCNVDALYQKEQEVHHIIEDRHRAEQLQQTRLAHMNEELARQKSALEQALAAAERNNEIISAIGRIYWLIYRLDLAAGTYEEISVSDGQHRPTGERGYIADRFPEACRRTVVEAQQARMLAFLDGETLADRLRDRNEISSEYMTVSGNWHLGRFIVQRRDAAGRAVKALYTIQIINEQKRRELEYEKRLAGIAEEAQRASLSKTDFLRRMSHDIRTPINGIRGMIEIANHYAGDLEKQQECREKVWEASGYLLSLVNNVLDMNKLESGALDLDETPFDLVKLLDESNTVAEMQATEHGLHYIVDLAGRRIDHRRLIGSPQHVKQVLMNLAGNAVKYNKAGGSVTVCCRELESDGERAVFRFTCADTGIGMSEEFQKRAFEPFSQEGRDNARTRYDGTGLGLSIVKALTEQMGGSIDFESREGVGTTFRVTLPFRIDPAPKPEEPEQSAGTADIRGVRVLLAEDNPLNQEIAQFVLEQHGAAVTAVTNGRAAVDRFAGNPPGTFDIILMDIMMPVMNGYDAAKTIRAMAREDAREIPIIAMSANAFRDDIRASRAAGMNEHLPKPLSSDRLLAAIRKYVPA